MNVNQLIYQIIKPVGGLRFSRKLSKNHPKIFMYHRLSATPSNQAISVDEFRYQIRLIKNKFNPICLKTLINYNNQGRIPENSVVITFDDGYKDFADYAWPILKEEGVKATIFVTTAFIDKKIILWPDELRYIINNTRKGKVFIPELGVMDLTENKIATWNKIADYCMSIENNRKNQLFNELFCDLDVKKPNSIPANYSSINWNQLKEMTTEGLEVGSHSHTHPVLTKLSPAELREELQTSKRLILEKLNVEASAFCYPNGTRSDFNDYVKKSIIQAGYRCAVVAYPSANPLGDDLLINRYAASIDRSTFEKNLFGLTYLSLLLKTNKGLG